MISEKDISIKSFDGEEITASIFVPAEIKGLFIMAHSFKSDRREDGRFTECGRRLAGRGIAAIAPDFRKVERLSIENAEKDLEACYEYMMTNFSIPSDLLAILGYSLGGRIAALFVKRNPEFNKIII